MSKLQPGVLETKYLPFLCVYYIARLWQASDWRALYLLRVIFMLFWCVFPQPLEDHAGGLGKHNIFDHQSFGMFPSFQVVVSMALWKETSAPEDGNYESIRAPNSCDGVATPPCPPNCSHRHNLQDVLDLAILPQMSHPA